MAHRAWPVIVPPPDPLQPLLLAHLDGGRVDVYEHPVMEGGYSLATIEAAYGIPVDDYFGPGGAFFFDTPPTFGAGLYGQAAMGDGAWWWGLFADAGEFFAQDWTLEFWMRYAAAGERMSEGAEFVDMELRSLERSTINGVPAAEREVGISFPSATRIAAWAGGPTFLYADGLSGLQDWSHVALVADGAEQTAVLYLRGQPILTFSQIPAGGHAQSNWHLWTLLCSSWDGLEVDEVRLCRGKAYAGLFTPPAQPFTP